MLPKDKLFGRLSLQPEKVHQRQSDDGKQDSTSNSGAHVSSTSLAVPLGRLRSKEFTVGRLPADQLCQASLTLLSLGETHSVCVILINRLNEQQTPQGLEFGERKWLQTPALIN